MAYLAFFYAGNIFSHHGRAYVGGDIIDKNFQGILELNTMSFLPSLHVADILIGVGVTALIKFIVYTKGKNAKKFRPGKRVWLSKMTILGYAVLLGLMMLKSGTLAKSVLNAH